MTATKTVPINVTEFKKSGYRCITPKVVVEQQPYQIVRPDGIVAAAIDSMLEGGLRPKRIWFWEERSYDRLSDIAMAVLRVEKRNVKTTASGIRTSLVSRISSCKTDISEATRAAKDAKKDGLGYVAQDAAEVIVESRRDLALSVGLLARLNAAKTSGSLAAVAKAYEKHEETFGLSPR